MSTQTIARRYATALADVVVPSGEALQVKEELSQWGIMLSSSKELQEVFSNPTVAHDQKQKLLSSLISRTKVRTSTANFLMVLLSNQRLVNLPEINERFALVLDQRAGVVQADITTARPLSKPIKAQLELELIRLTGSKVRLTYSQDQELIGGLVTRIGSTIYDGSIRNQLSEAKEQLAGTGAH